MPLVRVLERNGAYWSVFKDHGQGFAVGVRGVESFRRDDCRAHICFEFIKFVMCDERCVTERYQTLVTSLTSADSTVV